jgi:hypothetical protein
MEYNLFYILDIEKQEKFIKENIARILEIMLISFSSNLKLFNKNDIKKEKEYEKILNHLITNISKWLIWFFCVEKKTSKIVGFCYLYEEKLSYYKGSEKIETYKKISPNDKSFDIYKNKIYKNFYPVIGGLCKDPEYRNVGKFIIKELITYLKSKTSYKKLYLVCESTLFKFNYIEYIGENRCVYSEKYFDSNMNLIKYYKSNGFKILKKIFCVDECVIVTGPFEPDEYSDIICFNVMSKKI